MTARQPQDRPDAASVAATLLEPSFLEASAPGTEQQETVSLSTEHLDPTKLLPTPDEYAPTMVLAATERLDPTVVLGLPTLNATPATPASPTTHSRRRRFAFIGAAAAVLLVVIVLALSLPRPGTTGPAESSTSPSPKPAASSVAYPDVSGPLGDHLRQLQRSVAP